MIVSIVALVAALVAVALACRALELARESATECRRLRALWDEHLERPAVRGRHAAPNEPAPDGFEWISVPGCAPYLSPLPYPAELDSPDLAVVDAPLIGRRYQMIRRADVEGM